MTVKQAYEIFYNHVFKYEITEEFIRNNLTEKNLKRAKIKLDNTYNEKIISLRKKTNPSSPVLNELSKKENLDKINDEINKAYDILIKCITKKDYKHTEHEEKLLFDKYNHLQEEQKKQKDELEIFAIKKAAYFYMYYLQKDIKLNTDKTKDKVTWEMDLIKAFEEIINYNKKDKQLYSLLNKKEKELDKYLKLQTKSVFKETDIKYIEKKLSEKYFKYLDDENIYGSISNWKKHFDEYFEKKYLEDKATINNISSKAMQRLKNAKEIYILMNTIKCIDFIEKYIEKANDKTITKVEQIVIANKCLKMLEDTDKLNLECERKYLKFVEILKQYNKKNITIKEVSEIELMVKELITEEYLKYLNQQSYEENYQKYQEKHSKHQKNCTAIKQIEKKGRSDLEKQIETNIKYATNIDSNFKKLSKTKIKKMSTEELIAYHQLIKEDTIKLLKKEIKKDYESILTYYLSNLIDEKDLEIMYDESIESNNFEIIEKVYQEFKEINNIIQKNNQNFEENRIKAKKRLIDEINYSKEQIEYANREVPKNILEELNKISELSILELFDISRELGRYFIEEVMIEFDFTGKTK